MSKFKELLKKRAVNRGIVVKPKKPTVVIEKAVTNDKSRFFKNAVNQERRKFLRA